MADAYDIAVAGGGLAGLTAGLTAARVGRSVTVLTGGVPGGLLLSIERIEGLPGVEEVVAGYDLCPGTQELAEQAGAEVSMATLEGLSEDGEGWTLHTDETGLQARAVIVATGARFRVLGVPGEERLAGRGVSTCASCDAPLLRGKITVVVGGGDSALQEALTLAELVQRVVILVRDSELSAQASFRTRAVEHPKIEIRHGAVVEELLGDETLGAVRVRDTAAGTTEELEAAAIFPFIGLAPNSEPVDPRVPRDSAGRLITDDALRTALPGVLAAGLVRSGAAGRAAATAGEGAAAALAADEYLRTAQWPAGGPAAALAVKPGGS
jgi:thioredoxin reductase (NADPH)